MSVVTVAGSRGRTHEVGKTLDARHPLGGRARVLLTGAFGPYAQDDEYGSRTVNPMELWHNQVTRVQGGFSLRMFHRSVGLLLIQENIDAPCTVLDFPTLEGFRDELRAHPYEIIGIGAIIPNVLKVAKMCEVARALRPEAVIVVGGHVASIPDLGDRVDADHIVRGDGVRWMRAFLGQDTEAPVRHPAVLSSFGGRIMGARLSDGPKTTAAVVVPSVGCPMGCDFCSTSAMFGGKGRHVNFFETGDDLFAVMCELEEKLRTRQFFILDENFLLHRKRALRLLALMEEGGKSWTLNLFSSARVLASYRMEELVGLGVAWVWIGIEGKQSRYGKLDGVDTHALVRELRSHGIRVLGSTIIGLDEHSADNMDEVIDHAVSHDTDFHQFMLYTPLPGTPLHERMKREGTLLSEEECPAADSHGQFRFNYVHPLIRDGREGAYLLAAFRRDFEVNGPSLTRLIRTMLEGLRRYGNHPDPRIRRRYRADARTLLFPYAGAVWAARQVYRRDRRMRERLDALLADLYRELGWRARITAPLVGMVVRGLHWLEERRLARGWAYEPTTVREENEAARVLSRVRG